MESASHGQPATPVGADQLLDHAYGRLAPEAMERISRQLADDAELQVRYAELRRLRRLVSDCYQPSPVARPDARDEEMSGLIAGFVDAIRSGVLPDAPQLVPLPEVAGEPDEWDETAAEPARSPFATIPTLQATPAAPMPWRRLASYAAAAALLFGVAVWSFVDDVPLVAPGSSVATTPLPAVIEPPAAAAREATPREVEPRVAPPLPEVVGNTPAPQGDVVPPPAGNAPVDPVEPRTPPEQVAPPAPAAAPAREPSQYSDEELERRLRLMANSSALALMNGRRSADAGSASPEYLVGRVTRRGDIDGDGLVDSRDLALLLSRLLAGDAAQLGTVADVNDDRLIDSRDYLQLQAEAERQIR